MRHLVYSVTYSVVPVNSSLLTVQYTPRLEQDSFITTQNIQSLSYIYVKAGMSEAARAASLLPDTQHLTADHQQPRHHTPYAAVTPV